MPEANVIGEHMEVVGSDGGHVGTVDHLDGDRIKMTRTGSEDGQHHYLPKALVQDIKGNTVTLTKTAEEALGARTDEADEGDAPAVDPQMGVATDAG